MKKIYKYPTGAEIPEEAVYLSTVTQTRIGVPVRYSETVTREVFQDCWLVWHYFLVETND